MPNNDLAPAEALDLIHGVALNEQAIVSRTLRKSPELNLTLFSFDEGQALSAHSSPMDAYVQVLSGSMKIQIDRQEFVLGADELILMPANTPHALEALEPSRMLLTMTQAKKVIEG